MKKRETLDDIYSQILELRKDILDMKKQLNDITAWQLRSFIPPNTPSIPLNKCNICTPSQPGIQPCQSTSCPYKSNVNF